MLGLNKKRTLYTITALYYEKVKSETNMQQWNSTPLKFKCNYATSDDISRLALNQGVPVTSVSLETDSPISFKKGDKIIINGATFLVHTQVIQNNPLSGMFTNKPTDVVKFIILQ